MGLVLRAAFARRLPPRSGYAFSLAIIREGSIFRVMRCSYGRRFEGWANLASFVARMAVLPASTTHAGV